MDPIRKVHYMNYGYVRIHYGACAYYKLQEIIIMPGSGEEFYQTQVNPGNASFWPSRIIRFRIRIH
jgi:hypothetical protein